MHDRHALTAFDAVDPLAGPLAVPAGVRLTRCGGWRGSNAGLVWVFEWAGRLLCCEQGPFELATERLPHHG